MKETKFSFQNIQIEHIWGIAVLAGVFIFNSTHPIRLYDFWLAIAQGREILARGIPTVDPFSFTHAGAPFNSAAAYWLGDVSLYLAYKLGGPVLIILLNAILLTLTHAVLFYLNIQVSGQWRAAALGLLFSVLFGFNDWNVRPQIFAYLLGTLLLLGIHEYERSSRRGWLILLPISMVIWVNVHASFPLGILALGCWGLSLLSKYGFKRFQNLLIPFSFIVLAGLVCFVNPKGIYVLQTIFNLLDSPIQSYITEWRPPSFDTLGGAVFLFLFLALAVLMGMSSRRVSIMNALLFFVFGYFALKYIRSSVWFGLVLSPMVAGLLSEFLPVNVSVSTAQSKLLNRILLVLIFILVVFSLPWFKSLENGFVSQDKAGELSSEIPVAATQYLLDHQLPGNVFHEMGFGSYLMWDAYPRYKVFIDPRFDVKLYPPEFWDKYISISQAGSGWEEKLQAYDVNTLMLSPEFQGDLIRAADASPNWKKVYEDQTAIIFVKQ